MLLQEQKQVSNNKYRLEIPVLNPVCVKGNIVCNARTL